MVSRVQPEDLDRGLNATDAQKLAREILEEGDTAFSNHAFKQMGARDLEEIDCVNVIRGGWMQKKDLEHGSWRYPFTTRQITVVVAFRSTAEMVVSQLGG